MRRIWGATIGEGICAPDGWVQRGIVSKVVGAKLAPLRRLKLINLQESAVDGFKKAAFQTDDELILESVLIPLHKPQHVSLCLSSQIGCVMGCAFCATARMPKRRNLHTWEIVDQYIQSRALARAAGQTVTGVVFMGMGEPMLNYRNVIAAAELLCFPTAHAISGKAITISTVGLIDEIDRFTTEGHPFRLSISLGAAIDEKRARLVPVAARTKVRDVMAAARRHALARKDRVNLAYVCIAGENVGEEDAIALGELIQDTPVRLDLIDVRDATGRFQAPSSEEMSAFRDALRIYVKQPVARRYSGGSDINAACGTLAGNL